MNLILKAADHAGQAHNGQKRKYTGREYIEHPMRVAGRVSLLPDVTEREVCAAWLHDVFEDCDPEWRGVIENRFPEDVVNLIDELTNRKHHPGVDRKSRKNADRLRLQTVGRWAKIIKFVDRIDNVRDMDAADSGFTHLYLQESLLLANVLFDYTDPINKNLYLELMVEIAMRSIADRIALRYSA